MRTQEAAFRQSWKPKKAKKEMPAVVPASPKGIVKNAKRNDRRKAARAARSLKKALEAEGGKVEGEGEEKKEGEMEVKKEVVAKKEVKIEEESERMRLMKEMEKGRKMK